MNVVQPDLLFVSGDRKSILTEASVRGVPDLVVEILSPSTEARDLAVKQSLYARFGVREYWICDPHGKTIEVRAWTKDGYRTDALVHHSGRLRTGLFPNRDLDLGAIS